MPLNRELGTMITHGFARGHLEADIRLAAELGARCVEVLPDWRNLPDPHELRNRLIDAGLRVHSAHGCWGGQSIKARRVDLADLEQSSRAESVDDIRRCLDWLSDLGGRILVVHPGGLSDPGAAIDRGRALLESLHTLADHAGERGVLLCVENMPPGVYPGSRMSDLAALLGESPRAELALAIDTGHANITGSADATALEAGRSLMTTHVHDNNSQSDTHLPPGHGTVEWRAFRAALDQIDYRGPIMLECIRYLREHPESIDATLLRRLAWLCGDAVECP